jgi:hypothetical protein
MPSDNLRLVVWCCQSRLMIFMAKKKFDPLFTISREQGVKLLFGLENHPNAFEIQNLRLVV